MHPTPQQNAIPDKRGKQKLALDLLIILVSGVFVYILAASHHISERTVEFLHQYKHHYIAEIVTVFVFLVFATAVFSVRRWQEAIKSEKLLLQHNNKLQKALSKKSELRGILPICAECKKIRDTNGCWLQIEQYIHDHTEAVFSHGLCSECMENLYPDY